MNRDNTYIYNILLIYIIYYIIYSIINILVCTFCKSVSNIQTHYWYYLYQFFLDSPQSDDAHYQQEQNIWMHILSSVTTKEYLFSEFSLQMIN